MASAADEEPTSLDFFVLEPSSSHSSQGEVTLEELLNQREKAILKLCSICGSQDDGRKLRSFRVVVGLANRRSLTELRQPFRKTDGMSMPTLETWEEGLPSLSSTREWQNAATRTGIATRTSCCLSDEADEKLEELLRLLFYGHIEEDEPLMKVYEDCLHSTKEEIRAKYNRSYSEMRVDRVIFVASATPEDTLPERLITCVHRAARPSHHKNERRAVPIYGVLTKIDKVDSRSASFQEKKVTFMQGLGLNHSRFLACSNYCDDLDPNGLRTSGLRPELDVPFLRFMQLVCDRALKVVKEDEMLPGSGRKEDRQNPANNEKEGNGASSLLEMATDSWRNLDVTYRDAATAGVVGLLTLLVLYILGPTTQLDPRISEACKRGAIRDSLVCTEQSSSYTAFQQRAVHMLVAAIITFVVYLYLHVNRRL
ncbi:hypothetical protein ACOMHN_005273 [Nucella lapillus]